MVIDEAEWSRTFGRKVQPARERRLPDIIMNHKISPDTRGIPKTM
jgi:hypothetical protein